MAIKRKLAVGIMLAGLLVIVAVTSVRQGMSNSPSVPPLGTPLVRQLRAATKHLGTDSPIPQVSNIMYQHIPIGTPSDTAKAYLSAEGFRVTEVASQPDGVSILAYIKIVDDGSEPKVREYTVALAIIESRDSGAPKIKQITATTFQASL